MGHVAPQKGRSAARRAATLKVALAAPVVGRAAMARCGDRASACARGSVVGAAGRAVGGAAVAGGARRGALATSTVQLVPHACTDSRMAPQFSRGSKAATTWSRRRTLAAVRRGNCLGGLGELARSALASAGMRAADGDGVAAARAGGGLAALGRGVGGAERAAVGGGARDAPVACGVGRCQGRGRGSWQGGRGSWRAGVWRQRGAGLRRRGAGGAA
jgi:hypothetical protein